MDGFEKVSEFMGNMEDTALRYSEYKSVAVSSLDYHEVESEEQLGRIKKAGRKNSLVIVVVLVAFLLTGVFSIIKAEYAIGVVLILFSGLLVFLYLPGVFKKPMIKKGKAVWKQTRHTGSRHRNGYNRTYYVTVAFEKPEKMLCQLVQTSKEDYEKISEGTPVILVKKGYTYFVCVDDNGLSEFY